MYQLRIKIRVTKLMIFILCLTIIWTQGDC